MADESTFQYKRNFSLTVVDSNMNGTDLSQLHCKFSAKRTGNQTPNAAEIRVYNMASSTAALLQQTLAPIANGTLFTKNRGSVILQGGYDANHGVIFQGNIKQIIVGRESSTDTFVDFICGDGDFAYNYAVVNQSIAAGAAGVSQQSIYDQIAIPMSELGVESDPDLPAFEPKMLPRGKTMWGNSRDYMRNLAQQNGLTYSIQNQILSLVPQKGYLKGESVILTSKTGMIGTPQQTNYGVNVVCLMNPLINPGRTIKIDNASVAQLKLDFSNTKDPANVPPPVSADGVYYVLLIEQTGDNRGIDWYSKLICLTVAPSGNPINSIQAFYGP